MENFEFKSQICTTKEQSQKLLQMGLKESTADCHWFYHLPTSTWRIEARPYGGIGTYYPAWSLHRLLEIIATKRKVMLIRIGDDLFDTLIEKIRRLITDGTFNKDYLEEKL